MKTIFRLGLFFYFTLWACHNQGKDSVAKADSANKAKSESTITYNDTSSHKAKMGVDKLASSFMVDVADVGMTEIRLGKMAEDKAANSRVKAFGAMMVRDHSKADAELKRLARDKNVTLPSSISEDHQKKIEDLNKKNGRDFDKAYMDMMEDGHKSTIRDFENYKEYKDPEVKSFVNKVLPTLIMHLDSAMAIKQALRQ
jgi:putative membrane protein